MVEKKFIVLSLICIVFSVGIIGAVMMVNQKDSELQMKTEQVSGLENENFSLASQVSILQTDISNVLSEADLLNSEKLALQVQVSGLQTETNMLENENGMLQIQASTLKTEKATLEAQVTNLQTEMTTLNNEASSLREQVSNLQKNVAYLETEATQNYISGYDNGESDGYQLGYDEGYTQGVEDLMRIGWHLRDPTYQEVVAFINSDKTDENEYTSDYVCYDFTADFNYNATQLGYRCGFVYIEFPNSAHAIVCFNTTDTGIIYVEPQTDEIVTITIGQPYLRHVVVDFGII